MERKETFYLVHVSKDHPVELELLRQKVCRARVARRGSFILHNITLDTCRIAGICHSIGKWILEDSLRETSKEKHAWSMSKPLATWLWLPDPYYLSLIGQTQIEDICIFHKEKLTHLYMKPLAMKTGYWPTLLGQDGWWTEIEHRSMNTQIKNEDNSQPSWSNKLSSLTLTLFSDLRDFAGNPERAR